MAKRLISVKVIVPEKSFVSRFAISKLVSILVPSYYNVGTLYSRWQGMLSDSMIWDRVLVQDQYSIARYGTIRYSKPWFLFLFKLKKRKHNVLLANNVILKVLKKKGNKTSSYCFSNRYEKRNIVDLFSLDQLPIRGVTSLIELGFDQARFEIYFNPEFWDHAWFVYYHFKLNSILISNWAENKPK